MPALPNVYCRRFEEAVASMLGLRIFSGYIVEWYAIQSMGWFVLFVHGVRLPFQTWGF